MNEAKVLAILSIFLRFTSAVNIECNFQRRGSAMSNLQLYSIEKVEISQRNTCVAKVFLQEGTPHTVERVYVSAESNVKRYKDLVNREITRNDRSVKAIDMDNQKLGRIPQGFPHFFGNIMTLNANRCGLLRITKSDMSQFPSMTFLSAAHNKIRRLSSDLFENNPNIQIVNLAYNEIIRIGNKFLQLTQTLRILILEHNYCITDNFELNKPGDQFARKVVQEKLLKLCPTPNSNSRLANVHPNTRDNIEGDYTKFSMDKRFESARIEIDIKLDIVVDVVIDTVSIFCSLLSFICGSFNDLLSDKQLRALESFDPCEIRPELCKPNPIIYAILDCYINPKQCKRIIEHESIQHKRPKTYKSLNVCRAFPEECMNGNEEHIKNRCKVFHAVCDDEGKVPGLLDPEARCRLFPAYCSQSYSGDPPEIVVYRRICDTWPRVCGHYSPERKTHLITRDYEEDCGETKTCLSTRNKRWFASIIKGVAKIKFAQAILHVCKEYTSICGPKAVNFNSQNYHQMASWNICQEKPEICELDQASIDTINCYTMPETCRKIIDDEAYEFPPSTAQNVCSAFSAECLRGNEEHIKNRCRVFSELCDSEGRVPGLMEPEQRCLAFPNNCIEPFKGDPPEFVAYRRICEIWPYICRLSDSKLIIEIGDASSGEYAEYEELLIYAGNEEDLDEDEY